MTELSLDIRAGSPLHAKLLKRLNDRYRFSAQRMTNQHENWRKSEEQHVAYLPEREIDARRRREREVAGKPQYTTIVLPYSYAMLMSAHSYWTTVFLARNPIFQFAGRHGETEQQVQALEALIDYQIQVGRMQVPLWFWLLDVGKFGVGILSDYWMEETKVTSSFREVPAPTVMGIPLGSARRELVTQETRGYYGNKLFNIRPYDYYPDPRVPLHDVQAAEYVGYHMDVGWNTLIRGAATGQYVNIREIGKDRESYGGDTSRQQGSSQALTPQDYGAFEVLEEDLNKTGAFGVVPIYVDLIPSEWGVGKGQHPEKWVFTSICMGRGASGGANGAPGELKTIIEARPLGCLHNEHPVSVLPMEPEAYTLFTRSMHDILRPIQNTMDWLINSHMYNVRKTLNNMFLADPSRVVLKSIEDMGAGGIGLLRPAAYGSDVRTAITQMPVVDVTAGHIPSIGFFHDMAQRAAGVNDAIMGLLAQGGRKTAQEVRTSSTFGVNRQKTNAEFFSAIGWGPLAGRLVSNSQQYFDAGLKLRIVGDLILEAGQQFIQVDPNAIAGSYDFVPVDGTMPIDRYQQANLWKELLAGLRQMPEIGMQYDLARIFAWVAQLAGLKNINKFRVILSPDQRLAMAAQKGNLVPLPGSRGPKDLGATLEPGQISGMGQTG